MSEIMRVLLILTALLSGCVYGVFQDEAFHSDYHHALLGLPIGDATFFHQPFSDSPASLIYSLSNDAVLGAVNPKDGSLVWRHALREHVSSSTSILRTATGWDTVVTAFDQYIDAWSASDGRFGWQYNQKSGRVKDIEILEGGELQGGSSAHDVVVLVEDGQAAVIRLGSSTGMPVWTFSDTR